MDLAQLAQVLPKKIVDWSAQDVATWLKHIRLPQFEQNFRERGIDGCTLLLMDHGQVAQALQTRSQVIRKKVGNWITFLNQHSREYQAQVSRVALRSERGVQQILEEQMQTGMTLRLQREQHQSQSQINGKKQKKELLCSTQKQVHSAHQNLFVYEKFGLQNHYYRCHQGRNMTIGKSAQNIIVLNELGVELNHCTIYHRKNSHFIKAKRGSGIWIKIRKRLEIDGRLIIQMGNTQFTVAVNSEALTIAITANEPTNLDMASSYSFGYSHTKSVRVGRSTRYELSFPTDSTMSGLHGCFSYINGRWYFEDMQTLNGQLQQYIRSWYRCTEDLLITDKLTFRLGKTSFFYECRLVSNEDARSSSSLREKSVCQICKKAETNSYFNPCHHCVSCQKCASVSQECCNCGWKIMSVERVFRS